MIVDLRKLNLNNKIPVNGEVIIPEDYYQNMDIIRISPLSINGELFINYEEEIQLNCMIKGHFIMTCGISLEEVTYPFTSEVEQIIEEKAQKNQINLDLLDVLWENVVLEVPIKVTKKDVKIESIKGEGWEVES